MIKDAFFPETAVILAGGKGTRLGLKDIPKPMVDIAGKPLLTRQLEWLRDAGVKRAYLLINFLSEVIIEYFKNNPVEGIELRCVVEEFPLGTAGALKEIEAELLKAYWVVYGDLVCDIELSRVAKFHAEHKADLTLVVHPNDHPYDSDLVEIDESNQVTGFLTKPHPPGLIYRNLVNAAVYLCNPNVLPKIEKGKVQDLARDVFPNILKDLRVFAYNTPEYLKDMGTPDRLELVRQAWSSGKVQKMRRSYPRPAVFLDRDGTVCEYVHHLKEGSQFKLKPHAAEAIRKWNQVGHLVFIVTNQPMIAKGLLTVSELEMIHKKMETDLGEGRAWVDGIYYCPHYPKAGFDGEVKALKIECDCRKPKTGLIEQACKNFSVDLKKSLMIGDSVRDIECGIKYGLKSFGILGGETESADDFTKAGASGVLLNLNEAGSL